MESYVIPFYADPNFFFFLVEDCIQFSSVQLLSYVRLIATP